MTVVFRGVHGVEKDNALQIRKDFLLALAGELLHIRHIHLRLFGKADGQGFGGGIHRGNDPALLDGAL